jgi:hypothetical protein
MFFKESAPLNDSGNCVFATATEVAKDFGILFAADELQKFLRLKQSPGGINLFECSHVLEELLLPHDIRIDQILMHPSFMKKLWLDLLAREYFHNLYSIPKLLLDPRLKFSDQWDYPFAAIVPGLDALHLQYFNEQNKADFMLLQYNTCYDPNRIPIAYTFDYSGK